MSGRMSSCSINYVAASIAARAVWIAHGAWINITSAVKKTPPSLVGLHVSRARLRQQTVLMCILGVHHSCLYSSADRVVQSINYTGLLFGTFPAFRLSRLCRLQ